MNLNESAPAEQLTERQILLLGDFRDEVQTFKTQEEQAIKIRDERLQRIAGGKETEDDRTGQPVSVTIHFRNVNPEELTWKDRERWELVKGSLIGEASVADAEQSVESYNAEVLQSGNISRRYFFEFLRNKISGIKLKQELDKMDEEKKTRS